MANHLSPPEFQGYFWLPEAPDRKLPGRFYCAEDGTLNIDVMGTFSGKLMDEDRSDLFRIVGISRSGEQVTLDGCFYTRREFRFPGIAMPSLRVNDAFIGIELGSGESAEFDSIEFYSDAINKWLSFASIKTKMSIKPTRLEVSYSPPERMKWNIPDGTVASVHSTASISDGGKFKEAKVSQETWVKLESPERQTLDYLRKRMRRFVDLVSFSVDQTIPINKVNLYRKDLVRDLGGGKVESPIRYYYATDGGSATNMDRITGPHVFFTFSSVRDRFADIVSRWFENYERLDSPFNLYFAMKRGRSVYLENRFLMLAQACESLHRRTSGKRPYSDERYAQICESLRKATAPEFREWLDGKLEYGNELSLRKRLGDLFKNLDAIFGGGRDIKRTISRVVQLRNYLTHYSAPSPPTDATPLNLHRLCQLLEALFQVHLALLCGFTREEVIFLCEQSDSFGWKLREFRGGSNDSQ